MSSSSDDGVYLAAIEGGGTTFVVSVGRVVDPTLYRSNGGDNDGDNNDTLRIGPTQLQILHTATIPPKNTTTGEISNLSPSEILDEACSFLSKHLPPTGRYSAVGVATFGPAGVDPARAQDYGTILEGSPKKEWRGVDLLTPIKRACGLADDDDSRVGFDTDVNAPAVAEFRHRCYLQQQNEQQQTQSTAKPLTSLSYITIGTGVGVGLVLNSKPIHGLLHPEGGHVAIQPLANDSFSGYSWGKEKSPYQGVGTVEGIASSVALTERWLQMEGKENDDIGSAQTREVLSTLPDDHLIWEHAANAIANLCVSILLLTSCQKIVLGGGIMKRTVLYKMVRKRVCALLNGYLDSVDELSDVSKLDGVIVESSWEERGSGLVGAFALALDAYEKSSIVETANSDGGLDAKESLISTLAYKKDEDKLKEDEQRFFTSGMLAGIGLSFGCVLLSSLFGGLRSRHKH